MKRFLILPILIVTLAIASVASVTVTSPASGATIQSPVKFVASGASRHGISGMAIYVDSKKVYSTTSASLDTSIPMTAGQHSVVVKAWSSSERVYTDSLTLQVTAAPTAPAPPTTPVPLKTTTSSLAAGTVGKAYSAALTASGGTSPYKWSVASGSLPAGLTLSTTGTISGTPTTAAASSFSVAVKDSASTPQSATDPLTLTVAAAAPPAPVALKLTTSTLASGTVGKAYSAALTATGGTSPYNYSVASGSLPAGLALSTSGTISGTPTAAAASSFSVAVKDSATTPQSATASLTLTVAATAPVVAPLQLTTSSLANGTVGSSYSTTLQATGGTAPYTWSVVSGSLPAGLTLSSSGTISGTPTTAVASSFSVTVKDFESSPQAATTTLALTIIAGSGSVAPPPTASGFYVSPTGNDANAGTLAAPFATFTKAQSAMQASSTKITYIRAGNYTLTSVNSNCDGRGYSCGLYLTSADNGETWSYYPPDGYDSASISGNSTGVGSGLNYMFYASTTANLTINGLAIHNFQYAGIGFTNGGSGFTAENNLIYNQYGGNDNAGGIMCYGCENATISHNVVHDINMMGINFVNVSGSISGLKVTGNVLYNICTAVADCGAIYAQDPGSAGATGIMWTDNYIRDGNTSAGIYLGSALYMDDCMSNVTSTGNIITGHNGGNNVMIHGGSNNVITGNLEDLSTYGFNVMAIQTSSCAASMSNNQYENNVVISGGAGGGFINDGSGSPTAAVANNDYYNYGSGTLSSGGYVSDSSASKVNPELSGWTYTITSGSPILGSPINFPSLPTSWGPPGYTIPQTGSAPSSPH